MNSCYTLPAKVASELPHLQCSLDLYVKSKYWQLICGERGGRRKEKENTVYAKPNTSSTQIWPKKISSLKSQNANLTLILISRLWKLSGIGTELVLFIIICPIPRTHRCFLLSNEYTSPCLSDSCSGYLFCLKYPVPFYPLDKVIAILQSTA